MARWTADMYQTSKQKQGKLDICILLTSPVVFCIRRIVSYPDLRWDSPKTLLSSSEHRRIVFGIGALVCIAMTVPNGDKTVAQVKDACSEVA